MKRSVFVALAFAIAAAGCSSSSSPSTNPPTKPTFTADLRPANEVPAVSGPEASGTGTATITFDVTRDASGNVTGGTATFVVNMSGFPAGTPINIAHIHQAPAGATGSIVFSTSLAAGEVTLATGSGSFTKSGIAPPDPTIIQAIINNPAGFYFNIHSTLNPGGVARGQLVKVN
jgi:CHRD domain-containing protein